MKILIVDDAKETRETLQNIIKAKIDMECEIEEAEDGLEALDRVSLFHPDIVLTDIMMPKMDGIALTAQIKSNQATQDIFVAAITGLSGEDEIEKIYASGVDFYIAKPFQLDDIVARLKVITTLVTQNSIPQDTKALVVHNCYNDSSVKHYFTTFSISKEDDIFLIFDYFSQQNRSYDSLILKDFMVTLVKTYKHLKNANAKFHLIVEESEDYIYVTLNDAAFIDSFDSLATKHSSFIEYKKFENRFTFRIDLQPFVNRIVPIQERVITSFENELLFATELLEACGDDIYISISAIKKQIKEYNAFCTSGCSFNSTLYANTIKLFEDYAALFSKFPQFDKMNALFIHLLQTIDSVELYRLTEEQHQNIMKNIEALNAFISQWIKEVVITQESADVHFLDFEIMNISKRLENIFKACDADEGTI